MRAPVFAVAGIGNALVDVLAHAADAFLQAQGLAKGAMTLIDAEQAERLEAHCEASVECSGGSAANTMVGIASLGGSAAYIGKVRDDRLGRVFRESIHAAGVAFATSPAVDGLPTGRCVVLVTPDAQRTMQTFLGSSAALAPPDIDPGTVASAAITFLEGYLWDQPLAKQACVRAIQIARGAGRKVALSLCDPFCVDRHRTEFQERVHSDIDVLFSTEEEVLALYESATLDEALERLDGHCRVAAITRGARGSLIVARGETTEVSAEFVPQVVDTTGAGDLYAAGFLFGLSRGDDLATCGRLGSIAAAEVVSHFGARPERSLAELVRAKLGV